MLKKSLIASAISAALILSGCGGGGSSSSEDTNDPTTSTLTGTVAAGAPLAGFIAIKDASGAYATAAIDESGNYTIDVDALSPPFVLFASGVAGGKAYTIASAATVDDVDGTVNITPLTDLIVGNIAGVDSEEFFNNPDFTKITRSNLDTASDALKVRLQAILDDAGIAAEFDLVNSSFTADHTGFDGVLDMLDVAVDTTNDTATISYALDSTVTITDDLAVTSDATSLDTSTVNVSADISATEAIALAMSNFNNEFSAGTPTTAALDPYFDTAFMFQGHDKAMAIGFFTSTDPVTIQDSTGFRQALGGFSITAMDTVSTTQTATISFGSGEHMSLVNNGSGWVMLGNGYRWEAGAEPETHWSQTSDSTFTNITFNITDSLGTEVANNDYFVITGPGLPAAGVVMVQYDFNSFINAAGKDAMIYGHSFTDAQIATIPDGAVYTYTRYRDVSGDTNVYDYSATPVSVSDASTLTGTADDSLIDTVSTTLIKRPLLSTETTQFAAINAPTETDLASFSDGSLTVSWTLPVGSSAHSVTLDRFLADGSYERAAESQVTTSATSATLNVPVPGSTITQQSVIVFTSDVFGRTAATTVETSSGSSSTTSVSVLGSWDMGTLGFDGHILTFFSNGDYFQWCSIASGCSGDSYELGSYSVTATGITVDSHYVEGEGGLDPVGASFTVEATGNDATTGADTILVDSAMNFTRVSDFNNPIVGTWLMGGSIFDYTSSSILVFYADGTYFQWANPSDGTIGCNGDTTTLAEIGTYSYDAASAQLTITGHIQNGVGGFDDPLDPCLPASAPIAATIAGDTMDMPDFGVSFVRIQ